MALINCEISLILTCLKNCFLVTGTAANQEPKFTITEAKLYLPVVSLSTQDIGKVLKQLESGFERTIYWNKYQSKMTKQARKRYLDFLTDPSFQGINVIFVFSLKDTRVPDSYKHYFLTNVGKKD